MWQYIMLDFETGETVFTMDVANKPGYNNMAIGMYAGEQRKRAVLSDRLSGASKTCRIVSFICRKCHTGKLDLDLANAECAESGRRLRQTGGVGTVMAAG